MASQQPTKVGVLVWCSLHTRTLICPEQCVKLSKGRRNIALSIFVQTVLIIDSETVNFDMKSPSDSPCFLEIKTIIQSAEGTNTTGLFQVMGRWERAKRAIYFVINKDQNCDCSSSCPRDQNIRLYHHFTSFICDRTTLF